MITPRGENMEIIGIIAEYNPFHNGHDYHLKEIKKKHPNSLLILVMSGNFTQRGDTSIINKWDKTKIALAHNIDLVIELPFYFACNSADLFAKGSIAILNELKATHLIFGSESNNINELQNIIEIETKKEFKEKLKEELNKGNSYPKAYDNALQTYNLHIKEPNDLLGLSYLREIKNTNSAIIPETIKRTNSYHDQQITKISSASAIRNAIKNKQTVNEAIPEETKKYLNQPLYYLDNYFPLLKYKIISEKTLKSFLGIEEGLESRIKQSIIKSTNLEELIENIKTKRYTYNRIKRTLVYILCNIKKEDIKTNNLKYIRILGFNPKGQQYLHQIKKDINLPIITTYKNDKNNLLNIDTKTTHIYYSIQNEKDKRQLMEQEIKQTPIIHK